MKRSVFLFFIITLILLTAPPSEAHRSGCHRWHSCPSDSGSYTCGDTGYCSGCPDNVYCLNRYPRGASNEINVPQTTQSSLTDPAPATQFQTPTCDLQACAAKTKSYCSGTSKATETYSCLGSTCSMKFDAKTNDECASKYCSGFNKEWDGSKCKVKCTPEWKAKADWSECVYGSQERTLSDGCGNEKNETRNCEPKCKDGAVITKTCPDGTLAIAKICRVGAWENVSNVCDFNQQEQRALPPQSNGSANPCRGKALCFNGTVTSVVNGDTLVIGGQKVQLALVDAPEFYQWGYRQAKKFTENLCKKGSAVIVDQDDLQPKDKYGRILGVVYCQNKNLNEELLLNGHGLIVKKYCRLSEFGNEEWAKEYGC